MIHDSNHSSFTNISTTTTTTNNSTISNNSNSEVSADDSSVDAFTVICHQFLYHTFFIAFSTFFCFLFLLKNVAKF